MSTKTSINTTVSSTSTAATTNNLATDSNTATDIKIKKELPSDEIKDFAETTMNELLGWYGFDDVDRMDLTSKTSRLLQTAAVAAAAAAAATNNVANDYSHQQHMEKRRGRTRATSGMQIQQQHEHMKMFINNNNNSSSSSNNNIICNANNNNRKSVINCSNMHGRSRSGFVGASGGAESIMSDHDTHSSLDENSKSPHSAGKTTIEEKIDLNNCCWCRRAIPDNAPEFLTTTDGPRYCSESCFTQSRRASFKKAKTCDWCKHVRHAVSYVDFQDGASQLQFCSDKCLNQYKMQIFCKETQAHLDMNPHLRDQGYDAVAAGNGAVLITPDLWLRNCRSRSASPASTISVSPDPHSATTTANPATQKLISPVITPPSATQSAVHKPLISVAPVSKLMSKSPSIMSNRTSPKHSRKKRMTKPSSVGTSETLSNLKANQISRELCNLNALSKSKSLLSHSSTGSLRASPIQATATNASALTQFAGSSVQDLHMSVPPLSPMLEQQQQQQQQPQQHAPFQHHTSFPQSTHPTHTVSVRGTSIPPAYFATPAAGIQSAHASPANVAPPGFLPPAFMSNIGNVPRFFNGFAGVPPHLHHTTPQQMLPPDMPMLNGLLGAPPPVTIMVPYPIIIPMPIPIPVPLPVSDFYKAHLTPEERVKFDEEQAAKSNEVTNSKRSCNESNDVKIESNLPCETNSRVLQTEQLEEPLDCTKVKANHEHGTQQILKNNGLHADEAIELEPSAGECAIENPTEDCSTRASTSNDDETTSPALHCIVPADDGSNDAGSKQFLECADEMVESDNDTKQKLPKFKITRLQTKRTLIQTKESECSRPLRKRKRIIDCDFQKIALKDDNVEPQIASSTIEESTATTSECNSNNNMKPNNKN